MISVLLCGCFISCILVCNVLGLFDEILVVEKFLEELLGNTRERELFFVLNLKYGVSGYVCNECLYRLHMLLASSFRDSIVVKCEKYQDCV